MCRTMVPVNVVARPEIIWCFLEGLAKEVLHCMNTSNWLVLKELLQLLEDWRVDMFLMSECLASATLAMSPHWP